MDGFVNVRYIKILEFRICDVYDFPAAPQDQFYQRKEDVLTDNLLFFVAVDCPSAYTSRILYTNI